MNYTLKELKDRVNLCNNNKNWRRLNEHSRIDLQTFYLQTNAIPRH